MGHVLRTARGQAAQALLRAVRYEPEGIRGSCPAYRQANYGPPDWKAFQTEANREILVIPLIEDPATVADMEALAAMPGIDVFFLGPFDFSVAAGVPGAGFDHPLMAQAIERMIAIARKHGKYVMTSVGDRIDTTLGRSLLDKGVRMISYSADALVFRRACQDIARLKLPAR